LTLEGILLIIPQNYKKLNEYNERIGNNAVDYSSSIFFFFILRYRNSEDRELLALTYIGPAICPSFCPKCKGQGKCERLGIPARTRGLIVALSFPPA
jgi:hypothetical protein